MMWNAFHGTNDANKETLFFKSVLSNLEHPFKQAKPQKLPFSFESEQIYQNPILWPSTHCLWLIQPTACFWEQHVVQWLISVLYILVPALISSWENCAKALPKNHFPPKSGKIKLYSWLSQDITPIP